MTRFGQHVGMLDPSGLSWFCSVCDHSMMHHDGDGVTEHFACCEDGCNCAWEFVADGIKIVRRPGLESETP